MLSSTKYNSRILQNISSFSSIKQKIKIKLSQTGNTRLIDEANLIKGG